MPTTLCLPSLWHLGFSSPHCIGRFPTVFKQIFFSHILFSYSSCSQQKGSSATSNPGIIRNEDPPMSFDLTLVIFDNSRHHKRFSSHVVYFLPKIWNQPCFPPRSPGMFQWEIIFKDHKLDIKNVHYYRVALFPCFFSGQSQEICTFQKVKVKD